MSATLNEAVGISTAAVRPPEHRNEILCVQTLRGLAVLIVLIVHVEDMANLLPQFHGLHTWFSERIGYSAPDLFFVISGFIMSYITIGMPFRPKQWAISRFVRIYPMYFAFTSLALALYAMKPDQAVMGSGPHTLWTILGSYLMVPLHSLPLLFVGWTVQHEVVFYCIVFLVATAMPTRMLTWVLGGVSMLALLRWCLVHYFGIQDWGVAAPSLYMFQFTMGALVYRFRSKVRNLGVYPAAFAFIVFMTAGALFADSGVMGGELPARVLLFGLAYSALLIAFLNREDILKASGAFDGSRRSIAVQVGDASYSMYLCHPFVLGIFGHLGRWLNLTGFLAWLWLPLAYLSVIACGLLLYPTIEKPMIKAGRRLMMRKLA